MLVFGRNFGETQPDTNFAHKALREFFGVLERTCNVRIIVPSTTPLPDSGLREFNEVLHLLKESGVIRSLYENPRILHDEPRFFEWTAHYADHERAGGMSATSQRSAIIATLAEGLERYLWQHEAPHGHMLKRVSAADMTSRNHIAPGRFAGFSEAQRRSHPTLSISEETPHDWVRGHSLTSGKWTYVPLQTCSAMSQTRVHVPHGEPLIRPVLTTGLATGVTKNAAIASGIHEIIERDAYMIMWMNQLTLPRVDLDTIAKKNSEVQVILQRARQYRLSVDLVRMITDAPTYAVCAVVRDESEDAYVPITIGLSAHRDLGHAASHAILEALRTRINVRAYWKKQYRIETIVPREIRHTERSVYWLFGKRYEQLSFLTRGSVEEARAEWEKDTDEAHLDRILSWCREKKYECVSVSFTKSRKNVTPWHVENVIMPDMQPMHMIERYPCVSGARLADIPKHFGYTPREKPFTDMPHPFS